MMGNDRKVRTIGFLAVAGLLTLALVALPVAPGLDGLSLDGTAAYARGAGGAGGAGGGGGPGGGGPGGGPGAGAGASADGPGNSGGNNGHGASASAAGPGNSSGQSVSTSAPGHGGTSPGQSGSAPGHSEVSGLGHSEDAHARGLTASTLGNLNAAHASEIAMSKASSNSIVGKIGALVQNEDIDQATLSVISNKTVDPAVVEAVEGLVEGKEVSRSDD